MVSAAKNGLKAPGFEQRVGMRKTDTRRFAKSDHAASKSVNPADHVGLVKAMANRLAAARGDVMGGDEWIGLCWEWLERCCAKFDVNNGANFSTYYVRACWRNATKYQEGAGTRNRTCVYTGSTGKRTTGYRRDRMASLNRADGGMMPVRCKQPTPAQEMAERDDLADLREKMRHYLNEVLTPEQAEIVMRRAQGQTLNEVGRYIGVTRERVRQRSNDAGYFDDPKRVLRGVAMP